RCSSCRWTIFANSESLRLKWQKRPARQLPCRSFLRIEGKLVSPVGPPPPRQILPGPGRSASDSGPPRKRRSRSTSAYRTPAPGPAGCRPGSLTGSPGREIPPRTAGHTSPLRRRWPRD
ncbi:DUF1294 domain-containing protein, partial [Dysosmobacter welbionis]